MLLGYEPLIALDEKFCGLDGNLAQYFRKGKSGTPIGLEYAIKDLFEDSLTYS